MICTTPEVLDYQEVRPMIRLLIERVHGTCPEMDESELISEANYAYVRATRSFNDSKETKFSSWCWTKVQGALLDYRRMYQRHAPKYAGVKDLDVIAKGDTTQEFWDKVWELSEETQAMIRAITSAPDELTMMWSRGYITNRTRKVRSYLRKIGWTSKQITKAFSEMRELMS
jgi:DNA-directed RNA polymerase specialized sigma24 family protein